MNERQYIELFPEKDANTDRLLHISIEVDDAEAMRAYLRSKGVKVPDKVSKGRIKNSNFMITDPDGHLVEIVQYEPDGLSVREKGKFMDETRRPRISQRMSHLGIIVGTLEPAMKFYGEHPRLPGDLARQQGRQGSELGQHESSRGQRLSGVHALRPDARPEVARARCTTSASRSRISKSPRRPWKRVPPRASHTRPLEIRTGINRKRQMNLYDPDGTRSELMEPPTVDGAPTPPSTAAPPR